MAHNETQKPVVNQMRDLSSAFDAIPDATMSEFIQSLTQWNDEIAQELLNTLVKSTKS